MYYVASYNMGQPIPLSPLYAKFQTRNQQISLSKWKVTQLRNKSLLLGTFYQ